MVDFLQAHDGRIIDKAAHDLAAWYHERWPETGALDFQAQIMLTRVAAMVSPPTDRAGQKRFNGARYNVLRVLYQAEGKRLLMNELAEELNIAPTNLTKLVNDLVADRLVRRIAHPEDKRKRWAELTDAGSAEFERELPIVSTLVHKLWDVLDADEKRQLVHLLSRFKLGAVQRSFEPQGEVSVLPAPEFS